MKMHTTITTIALGIFLTGLSSGASLLEKRAVLEGAKQEAEAAAATDPGNTDLVAVAADKVKALTAFDDNQVEKFGPGWLKRWQESKYQNPDDEATDIYINDGPIKIGIPTISGAKRKELLAYIATKPVLETEDLDTVFLFRQHNAELVDRIEEFAALLPSQGVRDADYFALKHLGLGGRPGRRLVEVWGQHMSIEDWFDLLSADAAIAPATYAAARVHLIAQVALRLIDKRKAAGQSIEGTEFDAAFAPVLAAFEAPKFDGLTSAVDALGINLAIPIRDYSNQEKIADSVQNATAQRTKFTTVWGTQSPYQNGLGSVMFVKGKDAYTAWRSSLLADK